jgi:hypothetical protein
MDKDPSIYVRHILEAIANIEMDTAGWDLNADFARRPDSSRSRRAEFRQRLTAGH